MSVTSKPNSVVENSVVEKNAVPQDGLDLHPGGNIQLGAAVKNGKLNGQKRKKGEEDEAQNLKDDAGAAVEEAAVAGQEEPILLAQAETATRTDAAAASSSTAGAEAGAAGAAGAEAGAVAGSAAMSASTMALIGLGVVGVAAAASGSGVAAAATPVTGFAISGTIALGQVNDNVGLTIEAYKADGTLLLTSAAVVNANGTFSITVTENYTGPVLLRLVDTNAGTNYTNEGTGAPADITTDLRAVVNVSGSGGANITAAITPLTELAVRELLGDAGGDMGTSGTTLISAATGVTATAADVTAANSSVQTAFGLAGDIVATAPVTVDNAAGFAAATAAQQAYGHVLAAIAGAEVSTGQPTGAVLNTLSQNLSAGSLGQVAVDQLLAGAAVADGVGANAGGTVTALTAVIATNISAIVISADTGTAGDFITQTAAQTINATLDVALAGTTLWGSIDNGTTWTDISGFVGVGTTTLSWTGVTLAAGDNVVKLAVTPNTVTAFTGAAADLVAGTKISMQNVALDTTAPVFANATANFAENGVGAAYAPSVTDAHLVTYTLGGADAASFTIDPNSGKVSFINSPNFEAPGSVANSNAYSINVTATDGAGNATTQAVTITVTDVNEAPTLTSGATASFAENAAGTVYTATATDQDAGATLTYALAGTDAALFNIDANTGAVTFAAAPNFEAPGDADANNVYDITVTASDGTNTTAAQAVAITVTNVNEAPTLTSAATANFAENGTGTAYTVTATDPDAATTLTYTLGGVDAALFSINATTGAITFAAPNGPNFEAPADLAGAGSTAGDNIYDITVTATDNGTGNLSASQAVAITVTDVNEAPTVVAQNAPASLTLAVNQLFADNVAAMFADVDANTTWTYSATGLPTGVTLNAQSGAISGTPTAVTQAAGATVVITASDGALSVSHTMTVHVVTAPVISGIAADVTQATSGDALTFTVTISEAVTVTGTPTLTLDVGGTAVTATYTSGTGTSSLTFTATTPATGDDATVTVTAINLNGGSVIGNVTTQPLVTTTTGQVVASFAVDNNNPTFTSATAVNYAENGTAAAYTAAATDTTALTYSLSGTDAGLFSINAATGAVSFAASPNFEVAGDNGGDNVYNVTVTATDAFAHAANQNVTITVTDVNEAPTVTANPPATQTFVVNQAIAANNDITGLFTDVDGDTLTYSQTGLPIEVTLDSGTGLISGTPTTTGAVDVTFTATDAGGLSVSHTIAVSIVSAPTLTSNIDNVTNFDVTSNIVLTASSAVTKGAGFIRIVNDANDVSKAGFHGEATTNTQTIDVTSAAVSITGSTITINPGFDLDLSNNYHIEVDAGAFLSGGVGSVAVTDATAMNFSTVTPNDGLLGVASAVTNAASQAMDSSGTLVASYSWMDIEGVGSPSSASGTARDLSGGNIAMVFRDYDETTVAGGAYDGIGAPDFFVSATNFGAGDLLYVDNQLNTQPNSLDSTTFLGDTPSNGVTEISFGTGVGGLGGLVDVTPVGAPTPSFVTALELQTLLQTTYVPIISA